MLRRRATGSWCRHGIRAGQLLDQLDARRHRARSADDRHLVDEYLESAYGGAEWQVARAAADLAMAERKLLPVRGRECRHLGLLVGVTGFDLFGPDEADARGMLLSKVRTAMTGRAKRASRSAG